MAADLIPPVPDDQSLGFIMRNWLFKMRRNVNQFVVDISTLVAQIATAITPSNPLTVSNIATYVNTNTIDGNYLVNINADKINAGSIRGINVNAAAHTTKGTYLTVATTGGEATVTVKDTTDFPASGTAVVFDTTNDRDSFTYTGKTATTLTGCSGVLSHTNGSTVIPLLKCTTIDDNVNETRFYGDRGDGTIEELAAIGVNTSGGDTVVGFFGSGNSGNSRVAVLGKSYSSVGVAGTSVTGIGGQFSTASISQAGCYGTNTSTGPGVFGNNDSSGYGVFARSNTGYPFGTNGNSTVGHAFFSPLAGRPGTRTAGGLAVIYTTGGSADARTATPKLMIADGTDWRLVEDYSIWTG